MWCLGTRSVVAWQSWGKGWTLWSHRFFPAWFRGWGKWCQKYEVKSSPVFGVCCPLPSCEHRNHQSLLGLSALFLPYNSVIVLWYKQQTRGFISSPAHLQGQNEWSPLKQKQNTCKDISLLIKPKLILQMYRYAKLMKIRISWKQLDQTVAVVKAEVFREKERQFQGFALFTILMTFITWLTRMLPSPMSLANSNMRFYCVCFLLLLLSKWCPSTLP